MTNSKSLLVIMGAGGHGRVVAEIAELGSFSRIVFVDTQASQIRQNLHWPVVGKSFDDVSGKFSAFVAIGDNALRLTKIAELTACGIEPVTLVHPSASVSRYAILGSGTVIMPQVVVNAGAHIGRGVIANSGCTIDHDCIIGDGVHISPGVNLAGGVNVGDCSWIGIGSCVREGLSIGRNVMVAAGSVVVSSIADGQRVFGAPARPRAKP